MGVGEIISYTTEIQRYLANNLLKKAYWTVVNRAFYGLDLESLDITESPLGRLQIGQFSKALL